MKERLIKFLLKLRGRNPDYTHPLVINHGLSLLDRTPRPFLPKLNLYFRLITWGLGENQTTHSISYVDDDDLKQGFHIEYDNDGTLIAKGYMKDNQQIGTWLESYYVPHGKTFKKAYKYTYYI